MSSDKFAPTRIVQLAFGSNTMRALRCRTQDETSARVEQALGGPNSPLIFNILFARLTYSLEMWNDLELLQLARYLIPDDQLANWRVIYNVWLVSPMQETGVLFVDGMLMPLVQPTQSFIARVPLADRLI